MIAALWLLTLTLITTSECIYAAPPLVEYRRSEDNRPLGVQDDYLMGEERPKRMVLSVQASLDALRKSWLQMKLRELMELKNKQIVTNRVILDNIGKRSKERHSPIEHAYYEPYPQHLDLTTLIRTLSDEHHQPNNAPEATYFDESNDIESNLGNPLQNMHFNIDDDAQNDRFIDLNDERAWLHAKQQRHFNQIQKQQRLNEQNKNFLRQWDNKQVNDRTQVPSPQAEPQQQQQHQQENQQQKEQRQPDNSQQPIKSFDNDERFMLQTFDTK